MIYINFINKYTFYTYTKYIPLQPYNNNLNN